MVNYLRKECQGCAYWKTLGEHCGAIMHGMKCVVGPLTVAEEDKVAYFGPAPSNANVKWEKADSTGRVSLPRGEAFTTEQMLDEAIARAEKGQARMAAYEAQMHGEEPGGNRFLLWSHENLANFAKDVLAQNNRLREQLAQIRELANDA